jgi:hypothetical protein
MRIASYLKANTGAPAVVSRLSRTTTAQLLRLAVRAEREQTDE